MCLLADVYVFQIGESIGWSVSYRPLLQRTYSECVDQSNECSSVAGDISRYQVTQQHACDRNMV